MTEHTAIKQLRRSRSDRKISGVCGGTARYFDFDPTLVRVLFIVSVFFTGGWSLLAYVAAWLIMPEEGHPGAPGGPGAPGWAPAGATWTPSAGYPAAGGYTPPTYATQPAPFTVVPPPAEPFVAPVDPVVPAAPAAAAPAVAPVAPSIPETVIEEPYEEPADEAPAKPTPVSSTEPVPAATDSVGGDSAPEPTEILRAQPGSTTVLPGETTVLPADSTDTSVTETTFVPADTETTVIPAATTVIPVSSDTTALPADTRDETTVLPGDADPATTVLPAAKDDGTKKLPAEPEK
ncbi:PspC domain-containing protein [Longispora urticae]